jgi:hypothetical protein
MAVLASGALPPRVEPLLMRVACAECGCLVDRGVIVERCDAHPSCCCGDLPVEEANEHDSAAGARDPSGEHARQAIK